VGCKGPTTYNACSTVMWNEGTSGMCQSICCNRRN
jgi:hydrogenase small subunit